MPSKDKSLSTLTPREHIFPRKMTPQEITDPARCLRAAQRLREQRLHIPHYKRMDEMYGMDYWLGLHSSCILSD